MQKFDVKKPDLMGKELEDLKLNIFTNINAIKIQHQEVEQLFDKLITNLRIYFEKYPPWS